MTEDQIRELLREMRDEPVPADSLARVRMRVDERVTAKRGIRWWIPALAVAALALLAVVYWPQPHSHRPAVVAVKQPEAPPVAVVTEPAVAMPIRVARRPAEAAAGAAIRIETADPNVVLILVTGGS